MPASTLELNATTSISASDSLTKVPKIAVISASSAMARTTASSKSKASPAISPASESSESASTEVLTALCEAESPWVESCSELLHPARTKAEAATRETRVRGYFNIAIELSPPVCQAGLRLNKSHIFTNVEATRRHIHDSLPA